MFIRCNNFDWGFQNEQPCSFIQNYFIDSNQSISQCLDNFYGRYNTSHHRSVTHTQIFPWPSLKNLPEFMDRFINDNISTETINQIQHSIFNTIHRSNIKKDNPVEILIIFQPSRDETQDTIEFSYLYIRFRKDKVIHQFMGLTFDTYELILDLEYVYRQRYHPVNSSIN